MIGLKQKKNLHNDEKKLVIMLARNKIKVTVKTN